LAGAGPFVRRPESVTKMKNGKRKKGENSALLFSFVYFGGEPA